MPHFVETADRFIRSGQDFVLATIVSRQGSTPRTAGTRMIVTRASRGVGTIGGGLLEARVMKQAAQVLAAHRSELMPFDLSHTEVAAMDMICGGRVEVLLEYIGPSDPAAAVMTSWREALAAAEPCSFLTVVRFSDRKVDAIDHCLAHAGRVIRGAFPLDPLALEELTRVGRCGLRTVFLADAMIIVDPAATADTVHLFGAGHVARPTAHLAAFAGFRVQVVDDREEFADRARFPEAEEVRVAESFESVLTGTALDRNAYVVIVTRGHMYDQTVLMQALRTQAGYIGMIGSRRKRDHIFDSLLKQGFTKEDLKRVHSPIGLDIGAETPEELAISIVAELVQARAWNRSA
jgi:xanthine dehydrogenase accessory factor